MTDSNTAPPRDDGLEWLRDIRREMVAEAGHDPRTLGQQLRELEKQYAHRMVRFSKSLEPAPATGR